MSDLSTPQTEQANHVDTLIFSKYIIPVVPKDQVLENYCIVIDKGRIVDLLPGQTAKGTYTANESLELDQHAITPGLVNAHGHSAMSLFRGIADDLPLMEWLNDHIWPAEGKWVSEDFVRDGTRLAIGEMIRSGTTCFSDMYFFPNIAAEVANEVGMRAQFCCPILDFPTIWASNAEEYIDKALALSNEYQDNTLVSIGFGPHAPYTVSDAPLTKVRDLVKESGLPVQIHLHETQHEVDEALANTGKRPIARLSELGLFDKDISLQCVHMTALTEEDISTLRESNASVVHCPESNLKLASGFCEADKLIKAGINVALGTDGAASNNDLDMFGEARTAALIAKPVAGNAAALNAHTALEMATINGAKALGIENTTGSLEVGKAADIIAINLNELNSQPSFDPISDIIYSVASNQVSHVWINGAMQLSDGELTRIDKASLIENAKAWRNKIKQTDV